MVEVESAAGQRSCRGTMRYFVALLALLLTLGAAALYTYKFQNGIPYHNVLQQFPSQIMGWKGGPDAELRDSTVSTLKVDEYINRNYVKGDRVVSLYIGYYRTHNNFVEIHTPENCQANAGWSILDKMTKTIEIKDKSFNRKIQFVEAIYGKDGKKILLLYFYKLIDQTTTSFFKYKYIVVRNSIFKNRTDAAFIRVILSINEKDATETRLLGEQFLRDIAPVLFRDPV